jgi:flagellar hook-length control protein FliK
VATADTPDAATPAAAAPAQAAPAKTGSPADTASGADPASPEPATPTASASAGRPGGQGAAGDQARDTAQRARSSVGAVLSGHAAADRSAPSADAPSAAAADSGTNAAALADSGDGASATAPATAPIAGRSLPSAPAAPYSVRLAQAAEAVQTTISVAGRDGITQARIQLAPESLGGIQIHLQHTDAGLVARVVADHPEAAQALARAGDELRRQLEQNGTHLQRLDISTTGGQDGAASGGAAAGGFANGSGTRSDRATAPDEDDDGAPITTTSTLGLAGTALVDVLA